MASTSRTYNKATGYLKKIIGVPVGELFPLSSNEVIIGRNSQSTQICIQDCNVSRRHCVLKWSENGWGIKDLKSVNGTFLDGKALDSETFHPLKDGAGIYLGPPGDAPVAFIFLTKLPNEQSGEVNENDCSQRNKKETTHMQAPVSKKSNNCMKRRSDPEATTSNESLSQRKRIATSSSPVNICSQLVVLVEDIRYSGNLSDCSISSLDSLNTRVRKMSARKEKNRNSRNKNIINAFSTSASPQLRSSNNTNIESKPSTSALPTETLGRKRTKVQKCANSKEFAMLDEVFNESENSTPDTVKGEDSQSLLNDSKILIECDPYPFSQPLPTETAQNKKKNKYSTEPEGEDPVKKQLKKATLELKELKADKLRLSRLVQELRSEVRDPRKKYQNELQKTLEDELMCTICTEVYMKAVVLGCSHTFCEFCINQWKKTKKMCPVCREPIASQTKILALDSFINKTVEQLDIETQKKRKELSSTREKAKVTQKKKKTNKRSRGRGRVRQVRSDSSDADELNSLPQGTFSELFQPARSVAVHMDDLAPFLDSDFRSDISDESDVPVEGNGYFGGYSRCYNCARRGHWANGCPYM